MALVGTELVIVTPIGPTGVAAASSEQVTVAALASVGVAPAALILAIQAMVPFLPTVLPGSAGKLWLNGNYLCVS